MILQFFTGGKLNTTIGGAGLFFGYSLLQRRGQIKNKTYFPQESGNKSQPPIVGNVTKNPVSGDFLACKAFWIQWKNSHKRKKSKST
jgi:hypothetical protein